MTRYIKIVFICLSIATLSISTDVHACNGGCPSGGGYLGIIPQFHKHFVGIRYRFRSFENSGSGATHGAAKHHFSTMELWGRFYPTPRLQVFVFVPFQINSEKTAETSASMKGLGDISFILNYTVVNTGDSLENSFKHTLLVGAGAKLPNGRYQQRNIAKQMYPITFQPGTGAYSGILSTIYTVRYEKFGLNNNLSYYYNGTNELAYSFGNLFSFNTSLFYWFKIGRVSLLPNVGTYYENTGRDIDNKLYVDNTGGSIGYGSIGIDAYLGRISLGVTVQAPYYQNLPNRIQQNDVRCISNLVWLF